MTKQFLVEKFSGEKEPFSVDKLRDSLSRSGSSDELIDKVLDALKPQMYDGVTTSEIYSKAFALLRKLKRSTAARYSLKNAIMELGPTGYPFEHFIGELIRRMGYEVLVGQLVQGVCVQHEVDVIARNHTEQFMVECKYYNNQGKYCNVQVPLYIDSRFRDIEKRWRHDPKNANLSFRGWIVTNTRFTTDAMDYGKCAGLHLVSWDYPRQYSLKDMVEKSNLFPITVLTTLTRKQKQHLLNKGIILVKQLAEKPGLLSEVGLTKPKGVRTMEEISELMEK
jgi:hypothetical protein